MQTIRIIISGGRAKRVEITGTAKSKTNRDIHNMLRSMPKAQLAKALNITRVKEVKNV